jgi:hypothetical protein
LSAGIIVAIVVIVNAWMGGTPPLDEWRRKNGLEERKRRR